MTPGGKEEGSCDQTQGLRSKQPRKLLWPNFGSLKVDHPSLENLKLG